MKHWVALLSWWVCLHEAFAPEKVRKYGSSTTRCRLTSNPFLSAGCLQLVRPRHRHEVDGPGGIGKPQYQRQVFRTSASTTRFERFLRASRSTTS